MAVVPVSYAISKYVLLGLLVIVGAVRPAIAFDLNLWEKANERAEALEAVLVDGPYYVSGNPYYVFEYMIGSETTSILVYDFKSDGFVRDGAIAGKVLATRDMALLTLMAPLFYAPGDPSVLPLAFRYETQNVRNFAEYVPLTLDEKMQLELFLQTYEDTAEDIGRVSELTNGILYPTPLNGRSVHGPFYRNFSYEGLQDLLAAYDAVYEDYVELERALQGFTLSGGLTSGAPIREKWGIVITDETLRKQLELISENGDYMAQEISLRKKILSADYSSRVDDSRLENGTLVGDRNYLPLIALLLIMGVLIAIKRIRPPIALILVAAALPFLHAAPQEIPTLEDLISMKLDDISNIEVKVSAVDMDEARARKILEGYPLLLEGEGIEVRGPVYVGEDSYYIFETTKDGKRSGDGFLVSTERELLLSNQHMAFQAIKALWYSDVVAASPLYTADPKEIEIEAFGARPPLDLFLMNLSIEVRDGGELEAKLMERPSFEAAKELAESYMRTFILLENILRAVPFEEADALTQGMASKGHLFESHSRSLGLSYEEYLIGRRAMYRARTLNRMPVMKQLSAMGLRPTKGQLLQDLASDIMYDNYFLWRMDKVKDPNLFARLAFKEGTETLPYTEAGEEFEKVRAVEPVE
jgi:hypothetical protein